MELNTLITPAEAAERLAEYQAQLASERTVEDDAIRSALRAAQRGLGVIQMSETIKAGGYFESGLPRLAVARANATQVRVRWNWNNRLTYFDTPDDYSRGAWVGDHHVAVNVERPQGGDRWGRGRTVVPLIPPKYRPRKDRMHLFHILWEVESWTPEPPVDPALIKHIRGDLWAVLAVWDLTPLERSVLTARLN